ncbi:unnamed protein product [Diamesa serratosioi]
MLKFLFVIVAIGRILVDESLGCNEVNKYASAIMTDQNSILVADKSFWQKKENSGDLTLLISAAYGCIPFNAYFYATQIKDAPEKIFVVDRRFFKVGGENAKGCSEYQKVCDLVYNTYQRFNNDDDTQVTKEGRFVLFKNKKFLVIVAEAPNDKEP